VGVIQELPEGLVDVLAGADEVDLHESALHAIDHAVARDPEGTEPGEFQGEGMPAEGFRGQLSMGCRMARFIGGWRCRMDSAAAER